MSTSVPAVNLEKTYKKLFFKDKINLNTFLSSCGAYPKEKVMGGAPMPGEKIVDSPVGSFIVLGKDRPGPPGSGHSADTNSATIDMVCGRLGRVGQQIKEKYPRAIANPSMKLDAARIYISERTDVDENFGLQPWFDRKRILGSAINTSAVAMKADNIRIMARESVKIVSMPDKFNSHGNQIGGRYGIDLIGGLNQSGPNTDIQPLAKGKNLVKAMRTLKESVAALDTHVAMHNKALLQLCESVRWHVHIFPFMAGPVPTPFTTPPVDPISGIGLITTNIDALMSVVDTNLKQWNHAAFESNFLKPGSKSYICSTFNKTT